MSDDGSHSPDSDLNWPGYAKPGETLRIRLPADFTVKDRTPLVTCGEPAPTLAKYSETTLADITKRFAVSAAYEQITRSNALADMLFMGYKPLTKWQKHKRRVKEFFGRFGLAYRALRGDNLNFED